MADPVQPAPVLAVARQHRGLARLSRLVAFAAIGLTLLVAARLTFVDGLLRHVTIDGPSMAPALCGAHSMVTCGDCGFVFPCDAEHLPADNRAACPNCGFGDNSLEAARRLPAERVLIDRWPLLWQAPRRGDVIAFVAPGGEPAVKRIAALPGDRLVVQGGDLYAGDQIIRKTPDQWHAVRLLVHDNDYQPVKTAGLRQRWRPIESASGWKPTGGGFRIEPTIADRSRFDWLEYEHWACTAHKQARGVAAPITDNDPYNQGETRRALNPVSDVIIACRLRTWGAGQLALAAIDGDRRFEIQIEPGRRLALDSAGQTLVERPLPTDFSRRAVDLEFGLLDQQVLLLAEGRTLLRFEYERLPQARAAPLHPLAIGSRGIGLQVEQLRVWRDVYYLDAQGLARRWQMASSLGAGEFAVLGDNQPVSIDSRQWGKPVVHRRAMLGHVYRPFWVQ